MATERSAPVVRRRDRRRDSTVRDIIDAANWLLVRADSRALSLREVARQVGMSAQAMYHYFESRDHLISALAASALSDLADAVDVAGVGASEAGRSDRLRAVGRAYRDWAIRHPCHFELIFGSSIRQPLDQASTSPAMRRLLAAFTAAAGSPASPETWTAESWDIWARVHGWVVLECAGRPIWPCCGSEALFDEALQRMEGPEHGTGDRVGHRA
jgi:AcrR family transcriptional regulator